MVISVSPGQQLTLRLESGGMAVVTAGQPYISALGEECVQTSGHPLSGVACLRDGEWVGLSDIFIPRPSSEGSVL